MVFHLFKYLKHLVKATGKKKKKNNYLTDILRADKNLMTRVVDLGLGILYSVKFY